MQDEDGVAAARGAAQGRRRLRRMFLCCARCRDVMKRAGVWLLQDQ
jgi:hypothetical protein